MPKAVIIEVNLDAGKINYVLRPCGMDTRSYGTILADVADQIARMIATEGGFDRAELAKEIQEFFNREMDNPKSTIVGQGQLQ